MSNQDELAQPAAKRPWKQLFVLAQIAIALDALAWNPFKPSNYEDCILDGVKNAKTDQAANAVVFACRQKFPEKTPAAPPAPAFTYEAPTVHTFSSLGMNRPTLNSLVSNLNITNSQVVQTGSNEYGVKSWDYGHHLSVEITNRNKFPIYGVEIGILPKKNAKCSWDDRGYTEIHTCSGQANPRASAVFKCEIPRIAARKIEYCLTGFGIYGIEADVNSFKIQHSIPSRK